jgi:hypothetical protein
MEFRKTIVLPVNNAEEARRLFRQMVDDEPFVLMVVLGDAPAVEGVVSKAGKFAGADDEPRRVIWARRLEDVAPEIERLKEAQGGFRNVILSGGARAFSTSIGDEIRDVITVDEIVDNVRVVEAYACAEQA